MRADQLGVGRAHQRVVHLHGHDHVDAAFLQIAQHRGALHGAEDAAVAVGREGDLVGRLQQDVARRGVNGRQRSLHERAHRARIEAEHGVLLEEGHGVGVVVGRGHKQERQVAAVVAARGAHARGVDGEQRVRRDRPDGEHPLGCIEAQARALASREQHHGHAVVTQRLLPHRPRLGAAVGVIGQAVNLRRADLRRCGRSLRRPHHGLYQVFDERQVERRALQGQAVLRLAREGLHGGRQAVLPGGLQLVRQFTHAGTRHTLMTPSSRDCILR